MRIAFVPNRVNPQRRAVVSHAACEKVAGLLAVALAGPLTVLVAAASAGGPGAQGPPSPQLLCHLELAHDEIRRLVYDGYQRSATFRSLSEEISRSNGRVIMQYGLCSQGRFRSCLTDVQSDERQRYISITIDARANRDRLIAAIAHELAHATEILRNPNVATPAAAMALYRKIATGPCRFLGTVDCESQHALDVERQVTVELRRKANQ